MKMVGVHGQSRNVINKPTLQKGCNYYYNSPDYGYTWDAGDNVCNVNLKGELPRNDCNVNIKNEWDKIAEN